MTGDFLLRILKDATAERRLAAFGRKVLELAGDVAAEPDDTIPGQHPRVSGFRPGSGVCGSDG